MPMANVLNAGSWRVALAAAALVFSFAWRSGAETGKVTIRVVNDGSSATEFLVRDEVCVPPERQACEKARFKLESGICPKDTVSQRCLEARALAEGGICRADLLYDGPIPKGGSIEVKACLSSGGYASISVQGRNWNTASHRYLMLNDGDEVKYP